MKLNIDQINKVNEANNFIIQWCDFYEGYEEDLIFSDERIKEIIEGQEDIKTIDILFGGEDDYTCIETEDFLNLCDEIKSIQIVNSGLIKTGLRRYYIVSATHSDEDYIIRDIYNLKSLNPKQGITIDIVEDSFIVGLAATKLEEYDSDYWGTISQYLAVEITYENQDNILSAKEENELVNSYLFEVADTCGISLYADIIQCQIYALNVLREETEEKPPVLRDLETYNEGMRLFTSAVQIQEQELKFLCFYKVLEHFSPIAVNIEANELMRKKLDAPKSSFEDGDYIRSIFNLANSMRDKFNDEDLIKASFNNCFDFVGVFNKLPESIKKKIKKQLKLPELTYSEDRQKITSACNITGKIIYKTRNKVVHAKSNFTLTGDEVDFDELPQLNAFMKEACSQAIRWYGRQPDHLKLAVIK